MSSPCTVSHCTMLYASCFIADTLCLSAYKTCALTVEVLLESFHGHCEVSITSVLKGKPMFEKTWKWRGIDLICFSSSK